MALSDLRPWYFLLVGATLLAWPLVRRQCARRELRREVGFLLGGLLVIEAGLILLIWSRLACWTLAAVGTMMVATTATPKRPWGGALAMVAPCLAIGILFQTLPQTAAFLTYFGIGLPLQLLVPLAFTVSRWLRWDAGPGTVGAAAATLGIAVAVPFGGFAFGLVAWFEPTFLAFLVLGLVGIALLVGRGMESIQGRRRLERGALSAGEYAALPVSPTGRLAFQLVAACAVTLLGLAYVVAADGGRVLGLLVAPFAGVALLLLAFTVTPRRTLRRGVFPAGAVTVAALLAVTAALLAATDVAQQDASGGARGLAFYATLCLATLAAACAAVGLAASLANLAEASSRAEVSDRRGRSVTDLAGLADVLPMGTIIEESARADVGALVALSTRVRAERAPAGVLRVRAPADPLWTVPAAVEAWLSLGNDPDAPVHLAIEDGGEVFLLPPLLVEEGSA